MAELRINEDFADLLRALREEGVEYLIVGAHALAVYGIPRATGDLDIFLRPSADNAQRVVRALHRFGAPLSAHGIQEADFAVPGAVYQMGLPPRRIDLLTEISGLQFEEAWDSREQVPFGTEMANVIGKEAFQRNKRAAGRDKDLLDLRILEAHESKRSG